MKILFLCLAAAMTFGCNTASPVAVNSNTQTAPARNERQQTVISHSSENQAIPKTAPESNSGQKTKWTQGGSPIDTKEFDSAIAKAQMDLKAKPANPALISALADAYFKRGVALTDARQYASALGDYRRALKNDPSNAEAKEWIDKIIMIYDSMGRDSPKEGEEPPPLTKSKPIV